MVSISSPVSLKEDNVVSIGSKITCLHGTNSCLLPFLCFTECLMLPTGRMLKEYSMAPMSGEISGGGMGKGCVNQTSISFDVIEGISRCWKYASAISHSFVPPDDFSKTFVFGLSDLKGLSPNHNSWDPILIKMLRLKQWDSKTFNSLCIEHQTEIEQIRENIFKTHSENEMLAIKALEYPIEDLKKAVNDPQLLEKIIHDFFPSYSLDFYKHARDKHCYRGLKEYDFVELLEEMGDCLKAPVIYHIEILYLVFQIFNLRLYGQESMEHLQNLEIHSKDEDLQQYIRTTFKKLIKKGLFLLTPELYLQKIIREPLERRIQENMKPFQTGVETFLSLFNGKLPTAQIVDRDRSLFIAPYPLLLASTTLKPVRYLGEYLVPQARFGRDIDLVFVDPKHIEETEAWLKVLGVEGQVSVFPSTLVLEMQKIGLKHSPSQVIDYEPSLTTLEQRNLNQRLNLEVFPLYQKPCKDGSFRHHHGVPHAARTTFFSLIFMELYHSQGKKIRGEKGDLQFAAGMHDSMRESDRGEDLWDEPSGRLCTDRLIAVGRKKEDAEFFGRCIAEKDNPSFSLEQDIVYDSDCIEIIRCLYSPDDFRPDKLRAMKNLEQDTVYALIAEAKKFIRLTEGKVIKTFLEECDEPYKALLQIVYLGQKQFPLLVQLSMSGIDALARPSDYLLTNEVEKEILSFKS